MTMPPTNLTSEQLLNKLLTRKRPYNIVPFPRNDDKGNPIGYIAMVVLTEKEEIDINDFLDSSIRGALKKKGLEVPKDDEFAQSYRNSFEMRQAVEILFNACRKEEDIEQKFFTTKEMIPSLLSKSEIAVLIRHYNTVQTELGPVISKMSNAEMDAWIEKLSMEKDNRFFLNCLTSEALIELVMLFVSRLTNSQTDNGSVGLQEDNIVDVL